MTIESDAAKWRKYMDYQAAYARTPKRRAKNRIYFKKYYKNHREEILARNIARYWRNKSA